VIVDQCAERADALPVQTLPDQRPEPQVRTGCVASGTAAARVEACSTSEGSSRCTWRCRAV
jgi:hypothetical protein